MKYLLICLTIVFAPAVTAQRTTDVSPHKVALGVELPGVHLNVILNPLATAAQPYSRSEKRIGITMNGKQETLRGLDGMQGRVAIHRSEDALKFVRLRTAYSTWMLWGTTHFEVEIVPLAEKQDIPNFGLRSLPAHLSSGTLGALSDAAYRAGRFSKPLVEQTADGFMVTRWLLTADGGTLPSNLTVQQVQESVMANGAYRRRILKKVVPPTLPNTAWRFLPFSM